MRKRWFICSGQVVTGPHETEEVKSRIAKGEWGPDAFVWWKGQREWLALAAWETQLPRLLKATETAATPIWYLDLGDARGNSSRGTSSGSSLGSPLGPMTADEMVRSLRGVSNLDRARVWSAGMANWTSVFEVADVMDLLGISRRAHERAPLMGSAMVSRPLDGLAPAAMRTASISAGGLGLSDAADLRKGDHCQLLLKCVDFPAGLHMQAEVIYVMPNGYAGLKFTRLQPEAQSLIHDYIRRFLGPAAGDADPTRAAA